MVVVARGRTLARGTVPELLAQTGQTDFEEAFVRLAFAPSGARIGSSGESGPTGASAEPADG